MKGDMEREQQKTAHPIPEDAHFREAELFILVPLVLKLSRNDFELPPFWIGVRRREPAEGDGNDRQHAILVAFAKHMLQLSHADESFIW